MTAAVAVSGGVYVNDIGARRLLLLDSALTHSVVVIDSTSGAANAYGSQPGTLLPFHGDSAILITPSSLSMLVLGPSGTVVRVMASPTATAGAGFLIGSIFGTPGFDARGRLVYYNRSFFTPNSPSRGGAGDRSSVMEPPDSAFVVRFDFAARTLDTAAAIRIAKSRTVLNYNQSGVPTEALTTALPPTTVDGWAVTSDGSLAVVRGIDYHVDWQRADGTWTSTARIPHVWEHMDDDQKTALIDSTATAMQVLMDSAAARAERARAAAVAAGRASASGPAPGGGGFVIVSMTEGPNGGRQTVTYPRTTVVKAALSEVPDYRPVMPSGAVRADDAGNLWIRTATMVNGKPVYDIVNSHGELVDRLQLPPFRSIAGFGPGVVYLGVRDSSGVSHLERARVR